MSAKSMYDLRETLCTELDQYSKKSSLARADLEDVHLMTDTIKNIDKITIMEEQGDSYSNGMWSANGSYGNYPPMMQGSSGRRGSQGRYPMEEYSGNRYGGSGYSNDDFENRMHREMNY